MSSAKSNRMAITIGAVLLLVLGYWSQRKSPVPVLPKQVAKPLPSPAGLAHTSASDSALATKDLAFFPKQAGTTSSPSRSAPQPARPLTHPPNESTKPVGFSSAQAAKEAVPVSCDQLILRSGELVEVTLHEVGVTEIRYKKCRWPAGPDYVVLKAEVLSIRFANGEIERFTDQ